MNQGKIRKIIRQLQEILNQNSHAPPYCNIKIRSIPHRISTQVMEINLKERKIDIGINNIVTARLAFSEILDIYLEKNRRKKLC